MSKSEAMPSNPSVCRIWEHPLFLAFGHNATPQRNNQTTTTAAATGVLASVAIAVVHTLVTTMASEAANANEEAKPPALICAPCWICLEDGPDDDGEPLVRDCACRGETSAGYHLSCIIDYAKVKANKAIDLREKKQKVVGNVHHPWQFCPNCKQPYMGAVSLQLAEALLEHTNHLPESHYIRFQARRVHLDTCYCLSFQSSISPRHRDYRSIEIHAKAILQILEENSSELAVSMFGGIRVGDQHIEAVAAGERVSPLAVLGSVQKNMGDVESAVVLFEKALEYMDVAEASGYWCDELMQRDFIERELRNIKQKMGLICPSEEVAEMRKNLKQLMQKKEDEMHIVREKHKLAAALLKLDPPEYFEAVKLTKECIIVVTRLFGPEHGLVKRFELGYDTARQEYREYLQDIAKKGKEQT